MSIQRKKHLPLPVGANDSFIGEELGLEGGVEVL